MFKETLSVLIIGHIIGDYYLQTNKLSEDKKEILNKVFIYNLIYFITMAVVVIAILDINVLKWAGLLSLIHFLVDLIKFYLSQNNRMYINKDNLLYNFDQLIHIITIFIVAVIINLLPETIKYRDSFKNLFGSLGLDFKLILNWLLAIMIIIKPVSLTIEKVLIQYQPITADEEEDGHPGAGSLIGILERLIILIMISQNQYAAIGFVLTSKSIARYNKIIENPQFSEYYLLGTLLSILLVIITYTIIFL